MTETMQIWDALSKTDPAHTKSFNRAGGFKGTAIKPMWVIKRLTEEFGACGLGWGVNQPTFQVVQAGEETMVYCTVSCWHGTLENVLWGVGGDKVTTSRSSGPFNDDEAFKKAFTDAIMNAFKFIGVAADVHMGLFDDSKYVQEVKADFAERLKGSGGVNPEGLDWYGCDGEPGMSAAKAKADGLGETFDGWLQAVDIIPTMEVWKTWCRDHDDVIKTLPRGWRVQIREAVDARKAELGAV